MKKMDALNAEISEIKQYVKEVGHYNHSLRLKKKELNEELEGVRAQVEASHRDCRRLLKEQEVKREEKVELTGSRYKRSKMTH